MVACGLNHQFVSIYLPETGETLQSFIHGFDLQQSLLLLDGLYPWSRKPLPQKFWVQIRCNHGFYNLQVQLLEIDGYAGGELITVKAIETELSHNRRWDPRVYFDTRQGPSVELQLDHEPVIKAYTSNLSRRGALLAIYGKNVKPSLAHKLSIEGVYQFNDHFQLTLDAVVKQSHFLRQPCCQTHIRLQFCPMKEDAQAQLDTFIHALTVPLGSNTSERIQVPKFALA